MNLHIDTDCPAGVDIVDVTGNGQFLLGADPASPDAWDALFDTYGVRGVIRCLVPPPTDDLGLTPAMRGPSFRLLHLPLVDAVTESAAPHFHAAAAFVRQQLPNGPVFVHCHAGISRSATIALAVMLLGAVPVPVPVTHGERDRDGDGDPDGDALLESVTAAAERPRCWSLDGAFTLLRAVRPIVKPNVAFMAALADLEDTLRRGLAATDDDGDDFATSIQSVSLQALASTSGALVDIGLAQELPTPDVGLALSVSTSKPFDLTGYAVEVARASVPPGVFDVEDLLPMLHSPPCNGNPVLLPRAAVDAFRQRQQRTM